MKYFALAIIVAAGLICTSYLVANGHDGASSFPAIFPPVAMIIIFDEHSRDKQMRR